MITNGCLQELLFGAQNYICSLSDMILLARPRLIVIQCLQCCCLEYTTMVVFVCDIVFSARGRLRITEVRVFCNY